MKKAGVLGVLLFLFLVVSSFEVYAEIYTVDYYTTYQGTGWSGLYYANLTEPVKNPGSPNWDVSVEGRDFGYYTKAKMVNFDGKLYFYNNMQIWFMDCGERCKIFTTVLDISGLGKYDTIENVVASNNIICALINRVIGGDSYHEILCYNKTDWNSVYTTSAFYSVSIGADSEKVHWNVGGSGLYYIEDGLTWNFGKTAKDILTDYFKNYRKYFDNPDMACCGIWNNKENKWTGNVPEWQATVDCDGQEVSGCLNCIRKQVEDKEMCSHTAPSPYFNNRAELSGISFSSGKGNIILYYSIYEDFTGKYTNFLKDSSLNSVCDLGDWSVEGVYSGSSKLIKVHRTQTTLGEPVEENQLWDSSCNPIENNYLIDFNSLAEEEGKIYFYGYDPSDNRRYLLYYDGSIKSTGLEALSEADNLASYTACTKLHVPRDGDIPSPTLRFDEKHLQKNFIDEVAYNEKVKIKSTNPEESYKVATQNDPLICEVEVPDYVKEAKFEIDGQTPNEEKCEIKDGKYVCWARFGGGNWKRGSKISCNITEVNGCKLNPPLRSEEFVIAKYVDYFFKYGEGVDAKQQYKTFVDNTDLNKYYQYVGKPVYFIEFPVKPEKGKFICSARTEGQRPIPEKKLECEKSGKSFCTPNCDGLEVIGDCGNGFKCCKKETCKSTPEKLVDASCGVSFVTSKCEDCTLLNDVCEIKSGFYKCKNNNKIEFCGDEEGVCLAKDNGLQEIMGICPKGLKCYKKETCETAKQDKPIDTSCTADYPGTYGKCMDCNLLFGGGLDKCVRLGFVTDNQIMSKLKQFLFDSLGMFDILDDRVVFISNEQVRNSRGSVEGSIYLGSDTENYYKTFLHERLHGGSSDTAYLCDEYEVTYYDREKKEFQRIQESSCPNPFPKCCRDPVDQDCKIKSPAGIDNCKGFPYKDYLIKENDKTNDIEGKPAYNKVSIMGYHKLQPIMVVPCEASWPYRDPSLPCDTSDVT
jgi:hypothetical protein